MANHNFHLSNAENLLYYELQNNYSRELIALNSLQLIIAK